MIGVSARYGKKKKKKTLLLPKAVRLLQKLEKVAICVTKPNLTWGGEIWSIGELSVLDGSTGPG